MPKESSKSGRSKSNSRALRRLEPYNSSPACGDDREHGSRHSSGEKSSRSKGSRSRSRSYSRSCSPKEPPQWAKELLKNQQENVKELKRLQSEIERGRSANMSKSTGRGAEPSFRYVGNKTQYELNNEVVEKIEAALSSNDDGERVSVLNEGKNLLSERNKHILLAEKFGWDTVDCYTAEPLAADADDEKRIRKAVKESKQLREEKKKKMKPSYKGRRLYTGPSSSNEQKHAAERSSYASSPGFVTGKGNMARTTSQICFRCSRPGHFARECRAANTRTVTFNGPQSGGVQQPPASQ